jgi:hypothetical protein
VAGPDDGTWWAPAALARSSPAHKAQLVALVLAVACFLDLFRVLRRKLAQPGNTATATQAVLLTALATAMWTYFVAVHLVAAFNPPWLDARTEEVCTRPFCTASTELFQNANRSRPSLRGDNLSLFFFCSYKQHSSRTRWATFCRSSCKLTF